MLQLLAAIVPLGLAGAVSPMMLSEQTVLLAGPDGRRRATRYAIGATGLLLGVVAVLVVFGGRISLPREPHLSASLDIAIGAGLIAAAIALSRRRPQAARERPAAAGPGAALGFGVFSMATNVTTLAFAVPAAKEIAAGDAVAIERVVLVAVFTALASTAAWLPVVLAAAAPGPARRGLEAVRALVERRGRSLTIALLAGIGLLLVVRGTVRILTL